MTIATAWLAVNTVKSISRLLSGVLSQPESASSGGLRGHGSIHQHSQPISDDNVLVFDGLERAMR